MVGLDIDRARKLISSARRLFEMQDYVGVAGLSYQAFESGVIALLEIKNGVDQRSHSGRRKRAKDLLRTNGDRIDRLWDIRNVDYYGNMRVGEGKRGVQEEEAEECLIMVERLIDEIERIIEDED